MLIGVLLIPILILLRPITLNRVLIKLLSDLAHRP